MRSLKEFQQSRLKIDPTAKNLTESQWQQAFEAYQSSRKNVRGSNGSKRSGSSSSRRESSRSRDKEGTRSGSSSSERRASSQSRSSRGSGSSESRRARKVEKPTEKKRVKRSRVESTEPTSEEFLFKLSNSRLNLKEVRNDTAYGELRVSIRLMANIAIVLVILIAAVKCFYFSDLAAMMAALLEGLLLIVGILVLRPVLNAIIDIPDIALKKSKIEASQQVESDEVEERPVAPSAELGSVRETPN